VVVRVLTTGEAAQRLGVSAQEVRRLIAADELRATRKGRLWLVDEDAVAERRGAKVSRGRALAAATAWAALFEASGERAAWLDAATRSRLRTWLRTRDVATIAVGCRRRADRHALRVLPAYLDRVLAAAGVVRSGQSAAADAGADLVTLGDATAEFYCSAATLEELTGTFGLSEDGEVNLIVRLPRWTGGHLLERRFMPAAVVAVDLMEARDARTRRAGRDLLTALLRANVGHR
jgi:excisionase family DNA binding protein